jgi:hypothetical protein
MYDEQNKNEIIKKVKSTLFIYIFNAKFLIFHNVKVVWVKFGANCELLIFMRSEYEEEIWKVYVDEEIWVIAGNLTKVFEI